MESDDFTRHYIIIYLSARELVLPPLMSHYCHLMSHNHFKHNRFLFMGSRMRWQDSKQLSWESMKTMRYYILRSYGSFWNRFVHSQSQFSANLDIAMHGTKIKEYAGTIKHEWLMRLSLPFSFVLTPAPFSFTYLTLLCPLSLPLPSFLRSF